MQVGGDALITSAGRARLNTGSCEAAVSSESRCDLLDITPTSTTNDFNPITTLLTSTYSSPGQSLNIHT